MPPMSAALHALGHLAAVLEKRCPGLIDDWLESLESEVAYREIVRLRGPREEPEIIRTRREAHTWVKHIRLVTLAAWAQAEQAKRKRKRLE